MICPSHLSSKIFSFAGSSITSSIPVVSYLVAIPSSQRMLAEQTATIECIKLNGPCPNWSWKGPTINIRPRRYTLTTMRANATSILTINRLMEQDEGTYYCVCNGVRSGPSQVQVIRKYLSNRRICCACNWLQQGNGQGRARKSYFWYPSLTRSCQINKSCCINSALLLV